VNRFAMSPLQFCAVAVLLFSAPVMKADSKNIADYKLRIRVYSKDSTTFYHDRIEEESKGEGRGNLFEGDDVHGVDFNFACDEKFKASFGYETYPARWKKPGQVLTVLLPIFGKSNAYFTCNFNTDVKDFVYKRTNGRMGSEPEAKYKLWMAKHDYDPVHGKNAPTQLTPADAEAEPQPATPPNEAPATPK
jgi:hypothetical protein